MLGVEGYISSINPVAQAPKFGPNAFGSIPSQIPNPPSTYQQASQALPSLPKLTSSAGDVVQSELSGTLSQGTIDQLQNKAAQFGISSGSPGSGLQWGNFFANLGLTSEQLAQHGVNDYATLLGSVASTQNQPSLIADIAARNSNVAAAPDPAQAAQAQIQLAGGRGVSSIFNVPTGGFTSNPAIGRSFSSLGTPTGFSGNYYNSSTYDAYDPSAGTDYYSGSVPFSEDLQGLGDYYSNYGG